MMKQINLVKDMQSTINTLDQLVNYLTEEKRDTDEAIKWILTQNHPIFSRLGKLTGTPYRVFFTSRDEMEKWLSARGWKEDDWGRAQSNQWILETQKQTRILAIDASNIFDDNWNLKIITPDNWDDAWVLYDCGRSLAIISMI